ncbi:MAG: hypothetical protein FGM62_08575, partial [Methylobacterium sp.]|nr:hypothetical protein [Methylobacterium sp.]
HVFPLLGFQRFADETAMRNPARTGTFIDDSALYGEIRQVLETAAPSRPVFAFGITMQAHGDYAAAGRYPSAVTLPPRIAARLGPAERRSLATYAAIIQHHERATCEFIDWIKTRQRETVMLYFGDHLPALGQGLRPYQSLGILSEDVAAERYRDHRRLYTTPMFIWSNRRGFLARNPDPVPAFALGGSLMEAASLPVPAHFRFSLGQAAAYRDLACCYVNREGERVSLGDTPLEVLYRHAWDHLLRR